MNLAFFRFYEELNDFLPQGKRKELISYSFRGNPSVRDAIEALGVPHAEVDLILVNSNSVDFSYKLQEGDAVSVYPVFESFDISPVTHLREKPLREVKFIPDVHLGKLAKYLRSCGFDTYYARAISDNDIINLALEERRIILTRDIYLLKNKKVSHGYWIRSQQPYEQLREVILHFDLKAQIRLFSRCMECNCLLQPVPKDEILARLEPKTKRYYRKFTKCSGCDRIYWAGSHYERMKKHIKGLIKTV